MTARRRLTFRCVPALDVDLLNETQALGRTAAKPDGFVPVAGGLAYDSFVALYKSNHTLFRREWNSALA
jgi:hypothetical protein